MAGFLKKIKAAQFFCEPRQAVIDCDGAEIAALEAVWEADFRRNNTADLLLKWR